MQLPFQPMPLLKRALPFDDPDWLFELKYDGFRALAVIEHSRSQLISCNGNPFGSFADLPREIAAAIPNTKAVFDGEIVCVDKKGKPQWGLAVPPWRSMLLRIRPSILRWKGLAEGDSHGPQAGASTAAGPDAS